MGATEACRSRIMADGRTRCGNLLATMDIADACTADEHAALDLSGRHRLRERDGKIRVITGLFAMIPKSRTGYECSMSQRLTDSFSGNRR